MAKLPCFYVFVLAWLVLVQGEKYDWKDYEDRKKDKRNMKTLFENYWNTFFENVPDSQFGGSLQQYEKQLERLKRNDGHIKNHLRRLDKRLAITEEENRILKMQMTKSLETNTRLERDMKSLARNVTDHCKCHDPIPTLDTSSTARIPRTKAPSRSQRRGRLIAASHGLDTTMIEISLDDYQKKNFSINSGYISAIAYDPSTNGIIWSRTTDDHKTGGIYLSSLGASGEPSRLHPESATAMAVDSTKGWLIFTTRNTISRIGLAGGEYALIHNTSRFSQQRGITLDPGKRLIYTCDGDYIIETDYTGKHQRILLLGGFIVALTLDVDNNVLYFYEFDMIKKMLMKSGKTEVVMSGLGTRPKDLIYYDNRIYFTGMFEAYVKAYDLSRSTIIPLEQFDWSGVSLCLVS